MNNATDFSSLTDPTCIGVVELIVCTGRDADGDAAVTVVARRRFQSTRDGEWRSIRGVDTGQRFLLDQVGEVAHHWIAEARAHEDELHCTPVQDPLIA